MINKTLKTDVVVLVSWPVGYTAECHCTDLGLKTTLIESDDSLGGLC